MGVVLGISGAMFTGRLLQSLVAGASAGDPAIFILSGLLILSTAATSIWLGTARLQD